MDAASASGRKRGVEMGFDASEHPIKRPHRTVTLNCSTDVGGLEAMDCNGSSHGSDATANGDTIASQLGARSWIDRTEYVRLLEQALYNLGYGALAAQLERESGVRCQSEDVVALQSTILGGQWDAAVATLGRLRFTDEEQRTQARFLVLEQKYLETLEQRDWMGAVRCLRSDLSTLNHNPKRLQRLASCILCSSPREVESRAAWHGSGKGSRRQLLVSLQAIVPPDEMLPDNRLEVLIEQAIESQLTRCLYHNTHHVAVSLLSDYKCGREQIPTCTTQVLDAHTDEVWHVQFSHNGQLLATASKDFRAIVWEVHGRRKVTQRCVLQGHTGPITFLAWSPDDSLLATCGNEGILKLWDVVTGQCHRSLNHHSESVTCMAWLPDGNGIISGSTDKQMVLADINGNQLRCWKRRRVHDMVVTADGRRVLTIHNDTNDKVRVIDLQDDSDAVIPEKDSILSLSLSTDNKYLLVNLKNQAIHLWELPRPGQPMPHMPLQTYRGPAEKDGRYVVRSCFGGFKQAFVLSGSEEAKVYVWHRDSGELLAQLEGHSGTVNAVSWNPVQHHMFASASDDKTVNIWSVADEVADAAGLP